MKKLETENSALKQELAVVVAEKSSKYSNGLNPLQSRLRMVLDSGNANNTAEDRRWDKEPGELDTSRERDIKVD